MSILIYNEEIQQGTKLIFNYGKYLVRYFPYRMISY